MPSNSAVDQPHFLDVSSSNSKPDIKAADRVLPEVSIYLKNGEVLTSNFASNKIIFPSFLKVNSDLPTLKTKEHTYKYDIANFRYRGSNLSDIQRKEIIQNVFVPNSSFHFPKVDGRQFKREWLKQFPWLCYSPSMDGGFCLACVLFGHEFAKGSKVKLLRTDPVRSSPSAVSDFKRHVEGKREIMIKTELFIRILQPYFIVFRKKWKEIWKMLMRCWIGNLNLKSVKTEKY